MALPCLGIILLFRYANQKERSEAELAVEASERMEAELALRVKTITILGLQAICIQNMTDKANVYSL